MSSKEKRLKFIDIKRWYLELTKKTNWHLKAPENTEIKEFAGQVEDYRRLNRLIGEDLGWIDRQIIPDKELEKILINPDIKIYVLYLNQEAVGYTELDFTNKSEVVLEYFGLGPAARGKGLGKYLLQWTINEVWTHNPNKLKLHTSERDHPAALPGYLKCGFVIVSERMEKQAVVI